MKKKKWMKHIPLLIMEIAALTLAVGVLVIITRTTGRDTLSTARPKPSLSIFQQ